MQRTRPGSFWVHLPTIHFVSVWSQNEQSTKPLGILINMFWGKKAGPFLEQIEPLLTNFFVNKNLQIKMINSGPRWSYCQNVKYKNCANLINRLRKKRQSGHFQSRFGHLPPTCGKQEFSTITNIQCFWL